MDLPGGYSARPATLEDADAIAALAAVVDEAQGSEPTYRRGEILIDWNRPGFEIARDTWLIENERGVAAFGHLAPRGNTDLIFMVWIHPEHDDPAFAAGLIPAMEARGRAIAASTTYRRGVAIASENEDTLRRAIQENSFEPDAIFVEMVTNLGSDPEAHPLPEGIEITTCTPDETLRFYRVLVEAFSEHWGSGFPPFEEWLRDITALEGYDPYLSLIAWDGTEIAGVLFANMQEGLGEVHDIGVLSRHRGRGIGEALMREIFRRFRERGGNRARLWVDTANVTDAIRLYEKVGMRVAQRMHFYAKPLA